MVPLRLDQPRSQGATDAYGLGQDRTGGRKKIQTPYPDTAFGGGPALYPAPWLVRPPRCLCRMKPLQLIRHLLLLVASKPLLRVCPCCPLSVTSSWLHGLRVPQLPQISLLGQDSPDLFIQLLTSCDVQTCVFLTIFSTCHTALRLFCKSLSSTNLHILSGQGLSISLNV